LINLTIPLYPYIPSGSVYPWESPFFTEDIANYERNDARLFYISMGSEIGTRLIGPALFGESKPCIHEIPLQGILNRAARVVSIPKTDGGAIALDDITAVLERPGSFDKGDAVIIATGWGDNERWKVLGEKYVTESPFFTPEAAAYLSQFMQEQQSDLLLTDCLYLDGFKEQSKVGEWLEASDWVRLPYPSEHAKAFIRGFPKQEYLEVWKSTQIILEKSWIILGLSGCGQIESSRVQINCLPLFIDDVGQAPCTVVAEQL
jgi:kynurenine formamidase